MDQKTCTKCGFPKDEQSFSFKNVKTGQRHSWCRACHRGNHTQYNRQNKEKYREKNKRNKATHDPIIISLLWSEKSQPCVICGYAFHPVAMDFDHVYGAKKGNISRMVTSTLGFDAILDEISKCQVVCACCHRVKSFTPHSPLA